LRELREEVRVEARIVGFNRHVEWIDRDGAGKVLRHYVIASFVGEWLAAPASLGRKRAKSSGQRLRAAAICVHASCRRRHRVGGSLAELEP